MGVADAAMEDDAPVIYGLEFQVNKKMMGWDVIEEEAFHHNRIYIFSRFVCVGSPCSCLGIGLGMGMHFKLWIPLGWLRCKPLSTQFYRAAVLGEISARNVLQVALIS